MMLENTYRFVPRTLATPSFCAPSAALVNCSSTDAPRDPNVAFSGGGTGNTPNVAGTAVGVGGSAAGIASGGSSPEGGSASAGSGGASGAATSAGAGGGSAGGAQGGSIGACPTISEFATWPTCKGPLDDARMWRQVLDLASSNPESSCTAMFTFALISGIRNGWLTDAKYITAARNGRLALGSNDQHGQAPLLWAARAVLRQDCPGVR